MVGAWGPKSAFPMVSKASEHLSGLQRPFTNIESLADEPVSRILFVARPSFGPIRIRMFWARDAVIIPLGPESLRDSSSLPERLIALLFCAQRIRAGPALPPYLALLHAGFSMPQVLPPGRWALTPPFHPCQMGSTERGGRPVFPEACHRGTSLTGGLFSVALSVATPQNSFIPKRNPLALPGALPSCWLS